MSKSRNIIHYADGLFLSGLCLGCLILYGKFKESLEPKYYYIAVGCIVIELLFVYASEVLRGRERWKKTWEKLKKDEAGQ